MQVEVTHYLPEAVHALRQQVFVEEQGFHSEFDETDHTAWHLALSEDGAVVACCRVFPDGPQGRWHVGRVAVRRDRRGRGLGARVMAEAEAAAASMGAEVMALGAQVQAAGFYENLGYVRQGPVFLEQDCPHVNMEKRLAPPEAQAPGKD